jgi:hypothetical protein
MEKESRLLWRRAVLLASLSYTLRVLASAYRFSSSREMRASREESIIFLSLPRAISISTNRRLTPR